MLLTLPIAAAGDDATFDTGTGNLYGTDLTRIFVNGPGSGGRTGVTRFQPDIPAGKTIDAATLTLYPAGDHTDIGDAIEVRAVATDDYAAPAFGDPGRARTTASAAWAPGPAQNVSGGKGDAMVTPDLAAVLQEIVDRPGWAAGQGIGLMLDAPAATETGNTAYKFRTYDWNPAYAPVLTVTYSDGAGGTPVTLTVAPATVAPTAASVAVHQAHHLTAQPVAGTPVAPGVAATQGHALTTGATVATPVAPPAAAVQAHALTVAPSVAAGVAPTVTTASGADLTIPPAVTTPVATVVAARQVHLLTVAPTTGPPVAPAVTVTATHHLTVEASVASPVTLTGSLLQLGPVTRPTIANASPARGVANTSPVRTLLDASVERTATRG